MNSYYEGANWRIRRSVPPCATRILDVGCAAGRLGAQLKEHRPDRVVWGIEKAGEVAESARALLDYVAEGNIEEMSSLPCPEAHFDCILCGDVLEHLLSPEKTLALLKRYLAPDGLLITNVPNVGHWSVVWGLINGDFSYADAGLLDRTHLHFFTPQTFRQTLQEQGFRVLTEEAFLVPNEPLVTHFMGLAASLGINPQQVQTNLEIYQSLSVACQAEVANQAGRTLSSSRRPPCSIVMLAYNSMQSLPECLESLFPTLIPEDEVFLIDNASTDGTGDYLKKQEEQRPKTTVILNEENLGFSKGCNIGLRRAENEFVVLLNPDTVLRPMWLEGMLGHFRHDDVGAVGPLSNYIAGEQFVGRHVPKDGNRPRRSELPFYLKSHFAGESLETKLLVGFCLVLRRSLLEQFGYLDEDLFLGSEDLELSWRLRERGRRLLIARDVFVEHEGSVSFRTLPSSEKQRLLDESSRVLTRKLKEHYGADSLPSSVDLFGIDIFRPLT